MVDCHPEETLSTEAEPRSTMLSEGWRSTMSSRKECNIYFIMPNVPIPSQLKVCVMKKVCAWGNILLECYPLLWRRATFYLNVTRCYDVAQNAATSAIGFSIWTVRASFSRSQHFSECYPPLYILCKNGVTFKIFKQTTDQWNYRKLTWGIIIINVSKYLITFVSTHCQSEFCFFLFFFWPAIQIQNIKYNEIRISCTNWSFLLK